MKKLCSLALLLLFLCAPQVARAHQVLYVVRHAEKVDQSGDPSLSAAGKRRATALAHLLKDAGINAIYASALKRTLETAAPLAEALKLQVHQIDGDQVKALVKKLRAEHAEDRVLVVGHSDTVPQIIAAYGGPSFTLDSTEYDNLFVLFPKGKAPATVVRLRF